MPYKVTDRLKILRKISRPHWFEIIELIKCSHGMSVNELAEKMGMSYMGVKKHCLAMHKLGYLETWRRPVEVGRPEKIYRLTGKLDCLFPGIGNDLSLKILESAAQLEPNVAEKLLFAFFRDQTRGLAKVVTGDSVQVRAEKLASARNKMGYYSKCTVNQEGGLSIEEYHNPLQPLFDRYPELVRMETLMFQKLLNGVLVDRSVDKVAALTRYRFDLSPR